MNTDIRLLLSYRNHPKTKKLRLKLDEEGVLAHIYLLMFTAESKPDGILTGMDADDIALAADFRGDPQDFTDTLVALKLLDFDGENYSIHDWGNNNPWAAGAPGRTEKARKAANVRHHGSSTPSTNNQLLTQKKDATSKGKQCKDDDTALPLAPTSNAPSPFLSVSLPSPKKDIGADAPPSSNPIDDVFKRLKAKYPKRAGGNPWPDAQRALQASLKRKNAIADIEAGLERYALFCTATGKVGTELVMQAKRFFGPSDHWKETWEIPTGSNGGKRGTETHAERQARLASEYQASAG